MAEALVKKQQVTEEYKEQFNDIVEFIEMTGRTNEKEAPIDEEA